MKPLSIEDEEVLGTVQHGIDASTAIDTNAELLLDELIQRTVAREAIIAAGKLYAGLVYHHRTDNIPYQAGDGIARHGEFNRALADNLLRNSDSESVLFRAKPADDENVEYLCDIIFYDPFNQQSRFTLQAPFSKGGRKIQLLHLSGSITDHLLEVAGIGKARQEYLKNQEESVPKNNLFSFPNEADYMTLNAPNEEEKKALRILIVTERKGIARNDFYLWVCLPDGQHNTYEGKISLAAKHLLFQGTIDHITQGETIFSDEVDEQIADDFNITDKAQEV